MPYKDPEARKQYLREYYKKNAGTIKSRSKDARSKGIEDNPNLWADLYEKYKDSDQERKYLRRYNITAAEYDELFSRQGGKCAICSTPQSALKRRLAVDHCHKSGKVRGLLCHLCNTGLGHFKDSTDNMSHAIKYLRSAQDE